MKNLGARVYGLAAIIMGIAGLIWGDFATDWIPVPAAMPGRMALAYVTSALLLAGGVLINLPRKTAWGAGLLTAVFAAGFVLLDLTALARHITDFGYWDSAAEQLAVTMGGLIAFAASANIAPDLATRLIFIGRIVFGVCLFSFGAAHFVYPVLSATFVPKYIPPNQLFWVYVTGAAHVAAGLALLSNVLALLAARLLTVMFVIFGVLVHAPMLWNAPANHRDWVENALNLALVGVAWIVADLLARDETKT
jgi:uncharacterized membrane protein